MCTRTKSKDTMYFHYLNNTVIGAVKINYIRENAVSHFWCVLHPPKKVAMIYGAMNI